MTSSSLFCFGLGYTTLHLARTLLKEGWYIAGTCRTQQKQHILCAEGIQAYCFDRDHPVADLPHILSTIPYLINSVPPDIIGDPVFDLHGLDLSCLPSLRWFGYLSTTGVYGDTAGQWVDETAIPHPTGERQKRRLRAEQNWLSLFTQYRMPLHIFRLAGIYGPKRNALAAIKAQTAQRIHKPGHMFSRIHVEDIVTVLKASITHPDPGAIYNVCDDEPAPGHEVIAYASHLLGCAPPPLIPFEQAILSPSKASFYTDNRLVCNQRIKQDLGISLQFAHYRTGLEYLLSGLGEQQK